MPFIKDLFAKKEPDKTPKPSLTGELSNIPTEKVLTLRNQGLSDNQIVQTLQREGYPIDKISNAMNHANAKETVELKQQKIGDIMPEQMQGPLPPGAQMPPPAEPAPGGMPPLQRTPPEPAPPGAMPPPGGMPPPPAMPPMGTEAPTSEERLQEIAEAIIDEKWKDLIENVNKILEWKETAESRLSKAEQQLDDLQNSFDKLHEGILGKIGEYSKSVSDIGTEIKALEKVFQKILPGFVENVNELSRITSKMKAKK